MPPHDVEFVLDGERVEMHPGESARPTASQGRGGVVSAIGHLGCIDARIGMKVAAKSLVALIDLVHSVWGGGR